MPKKTKKDEEARLTKKGRSGSRQFLLQALYQYQLNGDDFNILIMKFNHIGKYIAVESKNNTKSKNYIDYWSNTTGSNWRVTNFEEFFAMNSELVKTLSAKH